MNHVDSAKTDISPGQTMNASQHVAIASRRPCGFCGMVQVAWMCFAIAFPGLGASAAESDGADSFRKSVEPILADYCYGCHSGETAKAKVAFDGFKSDRELLENRELWWKALKQLRAGFMPPRDQPRPSP